MAGIRMGGMRPKTSKHLRSKTVKHFRSDDPEAKIKYRQKMAARAIRRSKKK